MNLPPLIMSWDDALPVKVVRPPRGNRPHGLFAGQPWYDTGPHGEPLDFSRSVRRLIDDIIVRCPEWGHLQTDKILIGFTQANSARLHGLQARVTPLRFAGGQLQRRLRGHIYQIQRYLLGDLEYLYLLTFCLPRYLDQDFDQKLVTLFHELYHIGPAFDGDLRRHHGRYHLHSPSKCSYDQQSTEFCRSYLTTNPDPRLSAFLRLNFEQLRQRHGQVVGALVPRPKLVPLIPQMSQSAAHFDG